MQEIVNSLQSMIFGGNNDEIDSIIQPETKKELPTSSCSTSVDMTCMHSKNSELFISRLIQDYNLESIDNECKHVLNQAKKLFFEIFFKDSPIIVKITVLIIYP